MGAGEVGIVTGSDRPSRAARERIEAELRTALERVRPAEMGIRWIILGDHIDRDTLLRTFDTLDEQLEAAKQAIDGARQWASARPRPALVETKGPDDAA